MFQILCSFMPSVQSVSRKKNVNRRLNRREDYETVFAYFVKVVFFF